jgi:hypothetical protein
VDAQVTLELAYLSYSVRVGPTRMLSLGDVAPRSGRRRSSPPAALSGSAAGVRSSRVSNIRYSGRSEIMKRLTGIIAAVTLTTVGIALKAAAPSQQHCYDFDGLPVGTTYHINDTVNAKHATITFTPYLNNGTPVGGAANEAEVAQSKIAAGAPPEMGMKTLTVQIVPVQPVTRIRMKLAQNMTPTGGFGISNFEVNGERREGPSFADADGKRLGGAEFTATFSNPAGNWHIGTLELQAKPGNEIKSFSIGGHTWRLDDVCFAK